MAFFLQIPRYTSGSYYWEYTRGEGSQGENGTCNGKIPRLLCCLGQTSWCLCMGRDMGKSQNHVSTIQEYAISCLKILMNSVFPAHGLWFRILRPHCMYRELLGMDSSLIPLLDFPFISMLADRVANIFLSDKSTIPPHMKRGLSLLLNDTCSNVCVALPSPVFGIYLICWWKCSKSMLWSKTALSIPQHWK